MGANTKINDLQDDGGADENLDYLKVVHVLIRRPHSSRQALIKLGKRASATVLQLGYPTKYALKSSHQEYERGHDLQAGYVRSRPKYSNEQKNVAVEHYLAHDCCLAANAKTLGYPCCETLADWVDELSPGQEEGRCGH
jgi:hypothetical protein